MYSVCVLVIFYNELMPSWTPKTLLTRFDPRIAYWTLICLTFWTLLIVRTNMAGSVRSCCVPKCGKTRADNIVLHAFPDPEKDKERFSTWVKAVGGNISSLTNEFIYKNRKICHDHFEEKYLTWTRRLADRAVPTLRMPGHQIQTEVMRDITNIDRAATNLPIIASTSTSYMEPVIASTSASHMEPMATSTSAMVAFTSEITDITSTKSTQPQKNPQQSSSIKETAVELSKIKQRGAIFIDDKKALVQKLKKITKKKEKYAIRLKKALKLSENVTFQRTLNKFTSLAAIFLAMQFREVPKKKMGRRFTDQEKIMALSIYKQGPKCYRMLSKIFVLPSPLTLSRLIAQADLRAGINKKLFNVMKKKIKFMKTDDKLCSLLFDEVSITPHFEYNQRKDQISGFVTNGISTENKIADHALVFMVRGVLRNYKQPVAYTFCSGSTKKEELAVLIKSVIRELHSVGLRVLTTICDQGASNVSCINYLIAETKANYMRKNEQLKRDVFEVDGQEVIPLFDLPHLIKGVRNNLLDKNLKCVIDGIPKLAKWDHIIQLHQQNPSYSGIKLIKNLTEDHIKPDHCKMKVKFATQIFSQKVASTMGFLAGINYLPKECQQTADVLLFFDELFDSLNGSRENSKKRSGKPFLRAVTPNSDHHTLWAKSKKVLSTIKYLKNNKEVTIPSITNWLHTVKNVEYLTDILFNKYNIKSIWMRHFNQDPLENFFGAIRSHGYRNISPSPAGFEIAFASLLISNLTGAHSPGSNCEKDDCKNMFKSMNALFKLSKKETSQHININYMQENIFVDFECKIKDPRILAQLQYVTGYLLKQLKKNVFRNCISCKEIFYNKNKDSEYLRAREFIKNKQYLEYPTDNLIKMFSEIQDVLMWVLKNQSKTHSVKDFAKTILYIEVNTNFMNNCEEHKKKNIEFLFDLGCRFFLFNWCKDTNNVMKGRLRDAVAGDIIQNLALDYVRRRRKLK